MSTTANIVGLDGRVRVGMPGWPGIIAIWYRIILAESTYEYCLYEYGSAADVLGGDI